VDPQEKAVRVVSVLRRPNRCRRTATRQQATRTFRSEAFGLKRFIRSPRWGEAHEWTACSRNCTIVRIGYRCRATLQG